MSVRTSNIFLLALMSFLTGLAYLVETVVPQVTVTRIESPTLSALFSGRTVAHITDMHMVKLGLRERLTLSDLRRIKPDIIFMTGDYIEAGADFDQFEDFLRQLKGIAPVIATTGNNDYCCIERVEAIFEKVAIPLVENETVALSDGVDSIYVVGLEDNFLWHDDYFKALEGVPAGAKRIVLGHAPEIAEKIDPDGVELILAGHLHGGQVVLPLFGPLARNTVCVATRMYTAGLYRVNGINLYSNRGLGTSLVPLRFLSRPEIAVFEFIP